MKNDKGLIIVVEGPSGVGKDSIVLGLKEKYPNMFVKAPSTTTREMRENESQGNPYFFVSVEEFERLFKNGDIFESTMRHGTYRGMSKKIFDDILSEKLFPVKDCDKVGLDALRKVYGDKYVYGIFITCPKEMIIERLKNRGDSGEDLQTRIANYDEYVKNSVYYNETIENINLDEAVDNLYNKIMNYYNSL